MKLECQYCHGEGCPRCCHMCNMDRHVCRGCGAPLKHRQMACAACLELLAPTEPLCPLDVPDEIWEAVTREYMQSTWLPAPNYHVEYRDCRNAYRATLRHIAAAVPESDYSLHSYKDVFEYVQERYDNS